jgi:hypothetical protein
VSGRLATLVLAPLIALAPQLAGLTNSARSPAAAAPAHTVGTVRLAGALARVTATGATLSDPMITQSWSFDNRGRVSVSALLDGATARNWARPGGADFSLVVDSAPTSSRSAWRLLGVRALLTPPDPARPRAGRGVELAFRYGLLTAGGLVELDRTWTLYPGASVEGVSERIVNRTPVAWPIGAYTLAQLASSAPVNAEVQTYHGGSDWRQDFRVISDPTGGFDQEGEVLRLDDGSGAGWFFVGQRRSGPMSRVGRTPAGVTWVGVDNARDLLDAGPLLTSPPDYNTVTNPAYPVPVRQRTLLPGGELDLGSAYLGVYHGGAQQAAAAFTSDFAAHVMPSGRQTVDLNTFHPWGHGSGLSDQNLRPQAAAFKALGGEVFMLDDQWQGQSAGDWRWDTARFPLADDGVPRFVHYLHSRGLQLGLWMSPAEFNPGASVYHEHPNWACTPTGDLTAQEPDASGFGVWDMTKAALRSYLSGVISRLIAQDGVREFKFDYVVWVDCPPHDYLDYEDAYVAWVRALQAAHPGVTFELDETNDQRLWPFRSVALGPSWFDNGHLQGSSYPSRLLHDIFCAAPWIPPSSLGFGTYDADLTPPYSVDYLMAIALLGHLTFWTDLTKLSAAELAQTAWWVQWYERHRAALGGLVYEDTSSDPIDGRSWAAFQPWRDGRGYLFLFSQGGGTQTHTVALQGLAPTVRYALTDVRSGARLGFHSGAALHAGVPFTLAPYTAEVLAVSPAA